MNKDAEILLLRLWAAYWRAEAADVAERQRAFPKTDKIHKTMEAKAIAARDLAWEYQKQADLAEVLGE